MSNNKVTNVADPTANGDSVNYKTMNAMKTDLESQIENLSGLLDTANQKIQDLEQRVEELENNPPQPADPSTKFNQIDLSNYVGSLSGSTVNTASDFKAALQYILDNNTGKHFYYGTDHAGTTWYFASDTELSALSNDSYTCGNGVKNNGTAVQETFVLNKYKDDPAAKFVTVTGLDESGSGSGNEGQSFDTLNEALEKLGSYSRKYFYKINGRYIATDDEIVNGKTYETPIGLTISGATIEEIEGYTIFDHSYFHYTGTAHY